MSKGALDGIRVLDLGRVLAAPWGAQVLADMGAEVIKVEKPGEGDDSRKIGPDTVIDARGNRTLNGAAFLATNRNKRSVALDFSRPEGRDILLELVKKSDVVIENFLPGTLSRYGLDYDVLKAVNPGIILASLTGYGETGPYRDRRGYDMVFQAETGMMSVTGIPDGKPGAGPMKTGPTYVDICGGVYLGSAVLGALFHRERTGEGQKVSVNLMTTALAMQGQVINSYLLSGVQPKRHGNQGIAGHPACVYQCRDGSVFLAVANLNQYRQFCLILNLPDRVDDPRFQTPEDRLANRQLFDEVFVPAIAGIEAQGFADRLTQAGIPNAVVKEYAEVFADLHVIASGVVKTFPHAEAASGEVRVIGSPFDYSATPVQYHSTPPLLGEHTLAVLSDLLGLDESAVENLRDKGVIATRP